ncbi:MAG: DUF4038 domain-containing protein [Bacteroidota bacterium]
MQKLRISESHRFLVKENGDPFVWIGETNWFFAKLPPATIDSILDRRRAQGFTVMFVSCREELHNGEGGPGPIGKPNEQWWSYLDDYIAKCEQRKMYVGLTLGWWGLMRKHDPNDLYNYGKWVATRYRHKNNIIWLTMGEAGAHNRKETIPDNKMMALVAGIRDGDTGNKLLTIHADYKRGTSLSRDGEISDFNNWQTSQWCCPDDLPRNDDRSWKVWEAIEFDYMRTYDGIPKPTLDAEAWYENNKAFCDGSAFNIRRRAYFTIFAGAFGHTYGAGGIWDGLEVDEGCSRRALAALDYPGARHMSHISSFLHGLGEDFLKIRPDQSFIVSENPDTYDEHVQSVVAEDGSFGLVYSASDQGYTLDLSKLSSRRIGGIWYNPREDKYRVLPWKGDKKEGRLSVDPPGDLGPGNDWVFIVGDVKEISTFVAE